MGRIKAGVQFSIAEVGCDAECPSCGEPVDPGERRIVDFTVWHDACAADNAQAVHPGRAASSPVPGQCEPKELE